MKNLSIVVAIDQKFAIGSNGDLLCYLPADLKHFKNLTTGHAIIMGRKTFDSLSKGALPNRRNIVVTRNADFNADGVIVCNTIDEAIAVTLSEEKSFIIGGAQIYNATIDDVDTLYLTQIHATFDNADTFFPNIDIAQWVEVCREDHKADDKNAYDYSFITLKRR